MVDAIYFLVNTHDAANRAFVESLADRLPSYCFYTQTELPDVARHYDPASDYPYVAQFPALLVHVPTYTVPAREIVVMDDSGNPVTVSYQAFDVAAHYEFLEPCATYERAMEAVALYEQNLLRIAAGEVLDPNPRDFLSSAG